MAQRNTGPALDAALYGTPTRLGVIIATTTSKNNADTATPFGTTGEYLSGRLLLIQPDVACTIAVGSASTVTAASTDVRIEANERVVLNMRDADRYLACRAAVSGTVNLQVFELR